MLHWQKQFNEKIWNVLPLLGYFVTLHFLAVFGGRLLLIRTDIGVLHHIASAVALWGWMVAASLAMIFVCRKEPDLGKRRIRLLATSALLLVIAIILFDSLPIAVAATLFIMWTGAGWIDRQVEKYDLVKTFFIGLVLAVAGLVRGYFSPFSADEQTYFITFSVMMLLLHLIVFSMVEGWHIFQQSTRVSGESSWKKWGMLQGVIWGSTMILFGGAILITKGINWLAEVLFALLNRVVVLFGEAIYRFFLLLQNHERLNELKGRDQVELTGQNEPLYTPELDSSQDGSWTDAINHMFDIFVWIIIALILFWLLRLIWSRLSRAASESHAFSLKKTGYRDQDQSFTDIGPQGEKKRKHSATMYSDSAHPVRRSFKKLLKQLRNKNMWASADMTASQLQQNLPVPAEWYERVRYGEQELADDEAI